MQPSQGVGMSGAESPWPFSHWQFGFDNTHALGEGRLSPLSYDSLFEVPRASQSFPELPQSSPELPRASPELPRAPQSSPELHRAPPESRTGGMTQRVLFSKQCIQFIFQMRFSIDPMVPLVSWSQECVRLYFRSTIECCFLTCLKSAPSFSGMKERVQIS